MKKSVKIFDISKHMLTLWVEIHYSFYEQDIVAQGYDVPCPNSFLSWTCVKLWQENTCAGGLFPNKIAGWTPATIFSWDSRTGTFLWVLLSFTKLLFAEHFAKAVSVIFCQVWHFLLCEELILKTSDLVTMQMVISLRKIPLSSRHVKRPLFAWGNSSRPSVRQNIAPVA